MMFRRIHIRWFPILLLLILSEAKSVFAQQDPIYTQYMFNKMLINPGYTGSTDALSVEITDRFQWVGLDGAPNTLNFSVNSSLPNRHLGVGMYTYMDALGPTVETGIMGTFAYKLIFPRGKLSFGVQFGVTYLNVDWGSLDPENPDDPALNSQVTNRAAPDAGVGIYYYSDRFYAGLSSSHILQNKLVVSEIPDNGKTAFSQLMRQFYGITGYAIPVAENVLLRPALLVKYVQNAPVQADLSVVALFYNVFWIGVGYRTDNCLTLMTDISIKRKLHIGYSYDTWFNPLQSYNKGSHEIRIGYDFDILKSKRMLTPRYF
jgi:type IX secretion system PorP/SprF family membrane protein